MPRDPLADPAPLIRRVYAYVAYRVGDGVEAEDITSETFERALRYRESYDPRKGTPATWLLGIATRCVTDAATRRAREVLVSELPERAGTDEATETAIRLDLAVAVARLPERDRELVALRYGADLRAREIAELLGTKTGAVEVALHRALERLKLELDTGPVAHRRGMGELAP
jgi:RNA polymerase sigma-70 factor, ECF subfamily